MPVPSASVPPVSDRRGWMRSIGLVTVVLAIVSVATTWAVLTGLTPIEPTQRIVWTAMSVNIILIVLLIGLIAIELMALWLAQRRGEAGRRLQGRIVSLFCLIAVLPAIVLAVLASFTLDRGLDRWFEDRTRRIVDNATTVANAYVQEHGRVLRGDLIAMSTDLDRAKPVFDHEPLRFEQFFQTQSQLRQLPGAFLLRGDGTVIIKRVWDPSWSTVLMPPPQAYEQAGKGEPVVIAPGASNQVGGLMQLKAFDNTFLYVTRTVDARVLEYLRLARESAAEYTALETSRTGTQIAFALVYIGVAMILLLAAIWTGIGLTNRLVAPIRRLISAADDVSRGNLDVQVYVKAKEGDLAHLGDTFNTMTAELRQQRRELIAASDQIDSRRRFTEAVLGGVSAGVVGLDQNGVVTIANPSALRTLSLSERSLIGQPLAEVLPELGDILASAFGDELRRSRQGQITLMRAGRERIIDVRITSEQSEDEEEGFVVTFDDITDLVTAQRSSAWADVARRIAHEIKNPLTPIQLSAERIRRRYGKRIEDDRQVFDQCVDTIIRQVGDIERMVNEFSAFARMPKPQKDLGNLSDAVREAVFLQTVANPDITFLTLLPDEPMLGRFDHRLVLQALTNLVKNATEAIAAVPVELGRRGEITVKGNLDAQHLWIDVIDNGIGLPVENRQRLLEPYMTTREKGTGLGLAIVRKIAEDHGGSIELMDAPAVAEGGFGAMVRFTLPVEPPAAKPTAKAEASATTVADQPTDVSQPASSEAPSRPAELAVEDSRSN
ncbi:MAG: PAS domain-containing sensor histidine kinase [Hyphomicrobiaceae bacterium]|nr:PAS domain-containing sensor histidine kinase [Hyphomicrobiaceae bacterium]